MNNPKFSNIIGNGLVLIDTCFIMGKTFESFMDCYADVLRINPIVILDTVVHELENVAKKSTKASIISRRLDLVNQYLREGLLSGRQDFAHQTTHADQVFLRIIQQNHPQKDICLLTNDKNLRVDVYRILQQQSNQYHNHRISVLGFPRTETYELVYWDVDGVTVKDSFVIPYKKRKKANNDSLNDGSDPLQQNVTPFRTNCSIMPEAIHPTVIPVTRNIQKGSVVYRLDNNQYQPIYLTDEISSGGEGCVYKTNLPGFVCKIYHNATNVAKQKIELMVTRTIKMQGICWPVSAVYDNEGFFRGYLMREARGKNLSQSIFRPTWHKKHPNWTRLSSVKLVLNILKRIDYLHKLGVLLGDINENNILVENENLIYFVDCDSFQVEGYPCGVGMAAYVAPEIQGINFQTQLRTLNNELFAVAILLFMIMLPGKHPYSHQGGDDYADNIKKGHFPYPLGEKHSDRVPDGPWKYCWSHLSRHIKEEFYNCFRKNINNQALRPSVSTWIALFSEYQSFLRNPKNTFTGPVQNYGYDLQTIPENRLRVKKLAEEGNSFNFLRTDGKTDLEAQLDSLNSLIYGKSYSPSNSSYSYNPNTKSSAATTSKSSGTNSNYSQHTRSNYNNQHKSSKSKKNYNNSSRNYNSSGYSGNYKPQTYYASSKRGFFESIGVAIKFAFLYELKLLFQLALPCIIGSLIAIFAVDKSFSSISVGLVIGFILGLFWIKISIPNEPWNSPDIFKFVAYPLIPFIVISIILEFVYGELVYGLGIYAFFLMYFLCFFIYRLLSDDSTADDVLRKFWF